MENNSGSDKRDLENVFQRLQEIESRLSNLEKNTGKAKSREIYVNFDADDKERDSAKGSSGEIESKIGEYGMAWLGNIVLLVGIIFILQFLDANGNLLFSTLLAYVSVIGIYSLAFFLKKQHAYMSRLFSYNGHLLLFIVTLKMHFIGVDPLIDNDFAGIALIMLVIGALIYLSVRNTSQILGGLTLLMLAVTAVYSNSTHFMLSMLVLISLLAVYSVHRFGWYYLLIPAIVLVYLVFLMWFFNNPIITRSMQAVESLQHNYIYLSLCALIFSLVAILKLKGNITESQVNSSIILNGLGFSVITGLICMTFFHENYYIILGVIAGISVAYSALLQSRRILKLSSALYALYGFTVLSVTLAGLFKFPLAFLLLSIESLLVVSMALWFKSRFIVTMNVLMFLGLLIAYFAVRNPLFSVDISFALVALGTARIINWKKDRLEIQTEFIRNTYLGIGFIMTLVSLYHAVPPNYITFSWAMSAAFFFGLSIILHKVKYRWLAIMAMLCAAFYFFIVDLKQVSIGYRIPALLVIALISLSFSIYYSRRMKSKKSEEDS